MYTSFKTRMRAWRNSTLARNCAAGLFAQGFRLAAQAIQFIFTARLLGAAHYGEFTAALALVSIVGPFGSLGTGSLMVKYVARDPSKFSEYWSKSLIATLVAGSVVALIIVGAAHLMFGSAMSMSIVALLAVSDCIFLRLLDNAGQAFQAHEQLNRTAQLNLLLSGARLICAVLFGFLATSHAVAGWAWLYLGSTAFAGIIGVVLVHKKLGHFRRTAWLTWTELKEGIYFAVSLTAQTIYNDIDKAMLARMGGMSAVGIYAAAYRLIDASFAPVRALCAAIYPRMFQRGTAGIAATSKYAGEMRGRACGYASVVGLLLILAAPLAPRLFGQQYLATVEAIRWLALLPLFRAIHYLYSDALTASGHQGLRVSIQLGVAALNVLLNCWLLPAYGWRGAAWASVISDLMLVAGIISAVMVMRHRGQKSAAELASVPAAIPFVVEGFQCNS